MIKLLKRLSYREGGYIIISVIFILIQVYFDLKLPDYMSKITKLTQEKGATVSQLINQGKWMIFCTLGSLCAAIIVGFFVAKVAAGLSRQLRRDVFHSISEFGMTEINRLSTASLITRSTNDITQVQIMVAMGLQMMIKAPVTAVWAICKVSTKSWEWTIALGAAVVVILIVISITVMLVIPKYKRIQSLTDKLNAVTRENLTGVQVIRAYHAEQYQINKFAAANEAITATNLFTQRVMSGISPILSLVSSGLSVVVYLVGAYLIKVASVGIPMHSPRINLFSDMVVFTSYGMQVVMSFMMLTIVLIIYPRARVSAKRINEVIGMPVSVVDSVEDDVTTLEVGTVEFKDVYFNYSDTSAPVLEGISFKAEKGQTVAFIGSTGSGKSTLIQLIPRSYDVSSGQVLVDGIDVKRYLASVLYDKLGVVPQKPVIFNGTIRSNIDFGKNVHGPLTDDDILKALHIAQADDLLSQSKMGLDVEISQAGLNLSGGQKQRLGIARAVARRPEILIFDDSFSALDYQTDRRLRDVLREETADTTKLIVAQRIGTIIDADQIIVLDQGRIVGRGTHEELLRTNTVYQEIAYSQLTKEELGT